MQMRACKVCCLTICLRGSTLIEPGEVVLLHRLEAGLLRGARGELLLRLNKRVVLRDTLCELLCQVLAAPAVGLALLGSSCASTVGSSMWRALQCVL